MFSIFQYERKSQCPIFSLGFLSPHFRLHNLWLSSIARIFLIKDGNVYLTFVVISPALSAASQRDRHPCCVVVVTAFDLQLVAAVSLRVKKSMMRPLTSVFDGLGKSISITLQTT